MGKNIDEIKGRAKEAVGDVIDDPDLEREGKIDRVSGQVKDKAEQLKDKADDVVDRVKEKARDFAGRER